MEDVLCVLYVVTIFTTCSSSQKLVWYMREAGSTEVLVINVSMFAIRELEDRRETSRAFILRAMICVST